MHLLYYLMFNGSLVIHINHMMLNVKMFPGGAIAGCAGRCDADDDGECCADDELWSEILTIIVFQFYFRIFMSLK